MLSVMLAHPGFYSVVAELGGHIVGSNFLDERSKVVRLGPISIHPEVQDQAIGRLLMQHALERVHERGAPGVRLVQAAYHTRSLALYAKLGFAVREPLMVMEGQPLGEQLPGYAVREAIDTDLIGCDALCQRVHGHDRHGELADAVRRGAARVVERDGRLCGYATGMGFASHAIGESDADLAALIAAAATFRRPGFLLPSRTTELLRWALACRLRVNKVATLMTIGLSNMPQGPYLPSMLY